MTSLFNRLLLDRESLQSNNNTKFRSSLKANHYFIERLQSSYLLEGHRGCVNSVLFSDDGNFCYTGM